MTVNDIREAGQVLLESVSGSRAYGTDGPNSDIDLKGVFVARKNDFFGLNLPVQVNDGDDITFYEVGRFVDLLLKNNPNIVELLGVPDDCRRAWHPLFAQFRPELFLSRLCEQAFAGYALTQVRKARGLNKKIVNPMPEQRKRPVDFCYVLEGQGSVPLEEWLHVRGWDPALCGLVNLPHVRDVFALFYDASGATEFRGLFKDDGSTELRFSSVPRDMSPVAWMGYNKDGFKKHCKSHAEYWQWVKNRNEDRYLTNAEHGRNYDSKNMMHTFRLLAMAEEIAVEKRVVVRRPDREFLLQVRAGEFGYDDLLKQAEEKIAEIGELYAKSDLPDRPDEKAAMELLVRVRETFYG